MTPQSMPDSISHRQDRQAKRRCDPDKPDAEIDIRVVRRQTLRGQHRAAAAAEDQPGRTEQLCRRTFREWNGCQRSTLL